ncbi:hypothetical protein MNBD_NITROSPINAE02-1176 [hydrothermal vent metagenome]|uniref:DUF4340 domain-containing protein n=1 Tax=hydrothermal vent metagenome TaxID=652676 RepID=A0A3B1CFZ8_9ZZZZ
MRYFKTTFMWVIVLAAVAGYSYMDFETTRIEEKRKEEATRLFPFFPKDVLAITLNKEDNLLELERWEDGWRIIAPLKARADSEAVEKFLGYITDSRNDSDYVMDPDPLPQRLVEFGLANPTVSVTFKVGKDLKPYTIILGDRAPSKGVAYARLKGEKPVYRILAYARAEADKDIYYFRDKTVLRLNPVMIDQLVIERPEVTIRAKLPADGKWVLEKPIEGIADHNKVFELLGAFANTEIKEFVSETKDDLKSYGLDKPAIQLLFWVSGDSAPTVRLMVGKRSPEKRGYYISMSDRDNIFLVEEDTVNAIPREAKELRSKRLFFFESDLLKRIEIRKKDKATVLVRDVEKEWRRNNVNGEKVDFSLVKEFLEDLVSQQIADFITDSPESLSEYGLDPPEIQLLLWEKDSATPIYLNIGNRTPAGYVYASAANEGSILALDEKVKRILTTYF